MAIINIKIFVNGTTTIELKNYDGFDVKTNSTLKVNTKQILEYIEVLKVFIKGYESANINLLD